jgi:hypothetical protein
VTPPLPTVEELALADYKLGTARSDLDHFVTVLEKQNRTVTIEQYVDGLDTGEPIYPDAASLDQDTLARIVVFAADLTDDAEAIGAYGRKLLELARGLYHEAHGGPTDLDRYDAYRRAVRQWHEREAAAGEQA